MLMRHEGMPAAYKDLFLSNADNQVARHRRMLVPDKGVLISNKEVILLYQKGIAWAMQGTAHPRHSNHSARQMNPHATK